MKVFVTGGTGFVGSHLVEALLDRGDHVVCLVRDPAKAARLFAGRRPATVVGTLQDERALREGLRGADVVYHLAGLTAARSRAEYFQVNAEATGRLVRLAAHEAPALTRFVYVSSLAAAGPARKGRVRTEPEPPRPVSNYGRSKRAGEEAVLASDLPWTIVRPPMVYGPRDTELARVFTIARWGIVPVFGDPGQELSLIHARDLASALLAATAPSTLGKAYFAAHPAVVTSAGLVEAIARAVQRAMGHATQRRPRVIALPGWLTRAALAMTGAAARVAGRATVLSPDKGREFLAEAWTCSPAALTQDAGWRATIALDAGLDETARWYRAQGML